MSEQEIVDQMARNLYDRLNEAAEAYDRGDIDEFQRVLAAGVEEANLYVAIGESIVGE